MHNTIVGRRLELVIFNYQSTTNDGRFLYNIIPIAPYSHILQVKKGLEQLYRKVEKHLVEGSPLLQVVWRDMQDEFLQQLKHYDQLMGQCYPNSKTDLEFSIQDVLQYFSEIAQQH